MRTRAYKSGFTLIEMLVVVAIIAILVSMVVGITKRIDDQSKERLCRNTIALVGNALEQFRDFGYEYKNAGFTGFTFPLDCNNFSDSDLTYTIQLALNLPLLSVTIQPVDPAKPVTHRSEYSGSETLYFFLNQVPDCRTTLDKIDKSLLTNKDEAGNEMNLVVNGVSYPLMRFIDPWKTGILPGKTLRYDYYNDRYIELSPPVFPDPATKKTFPVITSAGPDGIFDTADDISNVK